ncbi:hypothetical protein [Micromonospora sp. HM5-17]|jgi:virginiamycin B lyase|uniref:Vgb family protein n=1 Tax=Micromonospora sp. HM5-17 TaxID=2487710 RepID=UPI000F4751FC|nr:hypothetical protein [Micromonospora sp. HM5-17]ROT32289.1 hypothetical protein EF879_11970 [Micromonospora sp. HM5-17]
MTAVSTTTTGHAGQRITGRATPRRPAALATAVVLALVAGCGGASEPERRPPPTEPLPVTWVHSGLDPETDGILPRDAAVAPNGSLWYVNLNGNALVELAATGRQRRVAFDPPASASRWVSAVAAGPDGAMWFTIYGGYVGRLSPGGAETFFRLNLPRETLLPHALAAGTDGAVYFAGSQVIGRISGAGRVDTIDAPHLDTRSALFAAPGGAVWYTAPDSGQVGRLAPGEHRTFPAPGVAIGPSAATIDALGNLWYARRQPPALVQVAPDGTSSVYALDGVGQVGTVTTGPDGRLWFGSATRVMVGSFDPVNRVARYYRLDGLSSTPGLLLLVGPDRAIWTSASDGSGFYRFVPPAT